MIIYPVFIKIYYLCPNTIFNKCIFNNMLRKIRLILALVCFWLITLLFLDFTGTIHVWFGWLAKVQFLPAVLALNVGVVLGLILLTLLLGRVYCSVICPLGVFQDVVAWLSKRSKKRRKLPYKYSPAISWLRYGFLLLFLVALVAGIGSLAALLAPYSMYGRIANNLFQPLWLWGNNLLAYVAERMDSYAFYEVEVWMKSLPTFIIALASFVIVFVLAWRGGRTYCNTICPVGTVLGFLSRYSLFRVTIDMDKCNRCGVCARNCKASCIQSKNHHIDYSRCVACMDCIDTCKQGAISYSFRLKKHSINDKTVETDGASQNTRRSFLTATAIATTSAILKAQGKKVDGGLATIEDKVIPERQTPLTPPGSWSIRNMAQHCTGCQLCVSVCPNEVLRPSTELLKLMQPEMSYERGYCRPECTKCSEVCPAGAIHPITKEDKSSTQIGHAVWIKRNCVVFTDDVECGNCARHCPVGAIQMIEHKHRKHKYPIVNEERCIGCGACENLCPARPFTAIYVEGHEQHKEV